VIRLLLRFDVREPSARYRATVAETGVGSDFLTVATMRTSSGHAGGKAAGA
jgi:hypothetical protein